MEMKLTRPESEAELYKPVHDFLIGNGYTVRSEVRGCDITAVKGDDLVVIELKRNFTTSLLLQATQRQRAADSVYIAIPVPRSGLNARKWRQIVHLLRRLELGLILVDPIESRIEVTFHPLPAERRRDTRTRRSILTEIAGRSGEYNVGGSTRVPLVTAYREAAIHVACALRRYGPLSPARLCALGTSPKTQSILRFNHYGWFERIDRGVYSLTAAGHAALEDYPALAGRYGAALDEAAHENGSPTVAPHGERQGGAQIPAFDSTPAPARDAADLAAPADSSSTPARGSRAPGRKKKS